ncbi:MAG: hypothetical protein ACSLFB_01090, partial [Acidimicrobiales bacterium]
ARTTKRPSGPSGTRLRPPEPFRPKRNVSGTGVALLALRIHRARVRILRLPASDDPFFWDDPTD